MNKVYIARDRDFDCPAIVGIYKTKKDAWKALIKRHYSDWQERRNFQLKFGRKAFICTTEDVEFNEWSKSDEYYRQDHREDLKLGFVQEFDLQ